MYKIYLAILILSVVSMNNAMEQSGKVGKTESAGSISPVGSPRGSFEEIIYRGFSNREKVLLRNTATCEQLVKKKITEVYHEDQQKNDVLINKHTANDWNVPTKEMSKLEKEKRKRKILKFEIELYKKRQLALVLALAEKNRSKIIKPGKNT